MTLFPSRHFETGSLPPDPALFGRKAAGLFSFPSKWTLPFVLLDCRAHVHWDAWSGGEREAWAQSAVLSISQAMDELGTRLQ